MWRGAGAVQSGRSENDEYDDSDDDGDVAADGRLRPAISYDIIADMDIAPRRIGAALVAALLTVTVCASSAHADTKWRKWNGMQSGEVVVCYGPSGASTFHVTRRSAKDGPAKWTTYTRCVQNAYGERGGRWIEWHDRQTGELLWCYGGVRFRPIEGARDGAQWAKCATRNLGRVG